MTVNLPVRPPVLLLACLIRLLLLLEKVVTQDRFDSTFNFTLERFSSDVASLMRKRRLLATHVATGVKSNVE